MIYLDNAATTEVYESSLEVFLNASRERYFNPSALYPPSVEAAKLIRNARSRILDAMRAPEGELYFTSGGTEADNWALFCAKKRKGGRIIVSEGEHDAIINPAKELKAQGRDVVFAPVCRDGSTDIAEFERLLTPDVALVSIMHVSNETGAINDIARLSAMTKRAAPDAVFHSDGVQAFLKVPLNLRALGADLYTISGHKLHAPKGIGALFVKKGVSLRPLIFGGGQEKGMRSGTENAPLILAFADAVDSNSNNFADNYSKKADYLKRLREKITERLPETQFVTPIDSAPHILTAAFKDVRGEVLLHALESRGILVGIGSACSSHHESRFKTLLGLDAAHRDGIVRFSVSQFNPPQEVDAVAEALAEEVGRLAGYGRK